MKKLLLLALALVMVMSVAAYGQGGAIMLYSDPTATSCEIAGPGAGTIFVYVFHSFTNATTASAFRVQQNNTNFVWLSDLLQGPTLAIGNSDVGGDYAYTQCFPGPHNFVNILYNGTGSAAACATLEVVAAPGASFIEGVDCEDNLVSVDGSRLTVNGDGSCDECGRIVPVQETNWGKIKAMYN